MNTHTHERAYMPLDLGNNCVYTACWTGSHELRPVKKVWQFMCGSHGTPFTRRRYTLHIPASLLLLNIADVISYPVHSHLPTQTTLTQIFSREVVSSSLPGFVFVLTIGSGDNNFCDVRTVYSYVIRSRACLLWLVRRRRCADTVE